MNAKASHRATGGLWATRGIRAVNSSRCICLLECLKEGNSMSFRMWCGGASVPRIIPLKDASSTLLTGRGCPALESRRAIAGVGYGAKMCVEV